MPLRCPAGALPAAYRVLCLAGVHALARGEEGDFGFESEVSEKCHYCTEMDEDDCDPVPEYVGEEFAALLAALDVAAAARRSDEEDMKSKREVADAAVLAAALAVESTVDVTVSQEERLSKTQILLASHQVLIRIREDLQQLSGRVASFEAKLGRGGNGGAPQEGEGGGRRKRKKRARRARRSTDGLSSSSLSDFLE